MSLSKRRCPTTSNTSSRGNRLRIIGLDYGSRTVGVAVSDALRITAQPLETITRKSENKLRRTLARIEELIREYDVEFVVLGLPLNMDGTFGPRAKKTLEFKAALEKRTGLAVIMQDERLSTFEAREILKETGVKAADEKKFIDKIAASYILQDFLNSKDGKQQDNL